MILNEQTVIGTWEMIEAWNIGDDSNNPTLKSYPWGNPSAGYWVYDKSGHFSLMISRNPPLPIPTDPFSDPPTAIPNWLTPNPPWKPPMDLLMDTFSAAQPYAYFGTYTVQLDENHPHLGGWLLHNVFSDILRAYTGTVQKRPFLFDGSDYLNIGVPGQYLRRLKRLT